MIRGFPLANREPTFLRFAYKEAIDFEKDREQFAIQGGRLTNPFKKWLYNRFQKKITSFI